MAHRQRSGAKIYAGLLAMVLTAQPRLAWAQGVGSPASILEKGQWVMGLGAMMHPGRTLEGNGKAQVYGGGHYRGYGLTNWLSLYGMLGAADVKIDDAGIVKTGDPSSKNSFGVNLMAEAQVKAKLFERRGWELDASAFYTDIRARHKNKNEVRWYDWQMAAGVAKSLGRFKPYAGARISLLNARIKVRENGALVTNKSYQQDSPFGAYLGTDVYFGEQRDVILNVEGSYINGPEMDVGVAYIF